MSDRRRSPRRASRPGGRFRRQGVEDPLTGVANLADLMLVFACGLLVALVLAWDLTGVLTSEDGSVEPRPELAESRREVDEMERRPDITDPSVEGQSRFRSVGEVYQDTTTGKFFVVEEGG